MPKISSFLSTVRLHPLRLWGKIGGMKENQKSDKKESKEKTKKQKTKTDEGKRKTAVKTEDRGQKRKKTKTSVKKATAKKPKKKVSFEVDLEKLLQAGVHFGHQAKRWHPKMAAYIWTTRDGVHIFDLVKTAECLRRAAQFVKERVASGDSIIFVGTKRQARAIIKEEATRCGAYYISERWLGGLITNWNQVKKSIDKLVEMKEKKKAGEYEKYTKKENILIDREISRLERFFGGLVGLEGIPEVIFVVDISREKAAVKEAKEKGVKVVALVDTDSNPEVVDYLIPGNDDAVRSVKLIVSTMADAVEEGKQLKPKTKNEKLKTQT